ncbi:Uncharacterized protein APZ42_004546, partial [Daphnia magna]
KGIFPVSSHNFRHIPSNLPVDSFVKLLADEEEPTFLAACESPLTNAGVEITMARQS